MGRLLGVMVVLALAGCAVPPPAGVSIPSYSPVREALSYFPASSPVVAVVRTDPQDPGLRRLAASGALAPLRRAARAEGVFYEQWSSLLGEPAVIGLPRPGAAPLAVLATNDADHLQALAKARVADGRAAPAGSYRGTDLYTSGELAFGVRDRVLIVSRTTRDLFEALDVRVNEDSFDPAELNDALPDDSPPAAFARAYVDLEPFVAATDAGWRSVPLLQAVTTAGLSVGATAEALQATMTTDLVDLADGNLPELAGGRTGLPREGTALAVADLAPLAAAAEEALRAARPVTALRIDALRAVGAPLKPELLRGPAVITSAPAVRLEPTDPGPLRAALGKRAFRRIGGVRFGFVGDVLVAGRQSERALRRLARQPLTPVHAGVAARLERPRPFIVTFGGSAERLTARAISPF